MNPYQPLTTTPRPSSGDTSASALPAPKSPHSGTGSGVHIRPLIDGLGGRRNIRAVMADHTRTNVWVHNADALDDGALRSAGVRGFVRGRHHVQLLTGGQTQATAMALDTMLNSSNSAGVQGEAGD